MFCLVPPSYLDLCHLDHYFFSLYIVVVLFFFSFFSKTSTSIDPPLNWLSINPPQFLFCITRARRTLKRKERVCEQATILFVILCCHPIRSIYLRHRHWKLFSFCSSVLVIFQVSHPFSRTGRTKVLNRRILLSFLFLKLPCPCYLHHGQQPMVICCLGARGLSALGTSPALSQEHHYSLSSNSPVAS